jgi:hypothetical protein
MSRFQATVGTVSALLTIGVTVATVYYNIENKKQEDFANQQKIQELEQRLNEKPAVVTEPSVPAPVVPTEPATAPPAPVLPQSPVVSPTVPVVPTVPVAPTLPSQNGETK